MSHHSELSKVLWSDESELFVRFKMLAPTMIANTTSRREQDGAKPFTKIDYMCRPPKIVNQQTVSE